MRLLIFSAILLTTLAVKAADFTTDLDVPYYTGDNAYATERCKLDIYHPDDNSGNCPVIVWFHGGGLTGGGKHIPNELKNCGYIVVAVNYRLLPKASLDECIDDAARAVAWTFENIDRYGGSADKIFVSGHSAGGYLTSMVGLDRKWLERYGMTPDSIAGLIPFSGQVITHFAQRQINGMSELQPSIDQYAPLYHVRPDAPPYIIITGDRNEELYGRYEENAYMWRMMNLVGHKATKIYELDGYNHGDMAAPAHHILKHHVQSILNQRSQKQ